jgi:hypothetical protein
MSRLHSFGFAMTLNRGAGTEFPIFNASTSTAKKSNPSMVLALSQSIAAFASFVATTGRITYSVTLQV